MITGRKKLVELDLFGSPIHRLWLQPGAELVTYGTDLTLHLVELRSDGAKIISFPTHAVASPGAKGRNGGVMRIDTHRATGTGLTVIARGERGGVGSTGANGANGADGSPTFHLTQSRMAA